MTEKFQVIPIHSIDRTGAHQWQPRLGRPHRKRAVFPANAVKFEDERTECALENIAEVSRGEVAVTDITPWAVDPFLMRAQGWSAEASQRFCNRLAHTHYENFPVLLSFFAKEQKEALAAIYAFARIADDFADEVQFGAARAQLINGWEEQLLRCQDGKATHPVMVALEIAMRRFELPLEPFLSLIDAFKQDCNKRRYDSFEELLAYCRRSANPVGQLVLKILGTDDSDFVRWSDSICTALQLTNFWQDLSVDLLKNRIYLPREDLDRFGISENALFSGSPPRRFTSLIQFEVRRTRELFRQGRPLLFRSGFPTCLYYSGVWFGGMTVLSMAENSADKLLRCRPKLGLRSVVHVLANAGLARVSAAIR